MDNYDNWAPVRDSSLPPPWFSIGHENVTFAVCTHSVHRSRRWRKRLHWLRSSRPRNFAAHGQSPDAMRIFLSGAWSSRLAGQSERGFSGMRATSGLDILNQGSGPSARSAWFHAGYERPASRHWQRRIHTFAGCTPDCFEVCSRL